MAARWGELTPFSKTPNGAVNIETSKTNDALLRRLVS
jgi:hypothetical protein